MKIDKSYYNENGSLWKNCATCSNCPVEENIKQCRQLSQAQTCKRAKFLLKEQKRNKK